MKPKAVASWLAAGLVGAIASTDIPTARAGQSEKIEARIATWGRTCKSAILAEVPNASMSDIHVTLSATTRKSIDAGELTLKDINTYGLIFNWQRPFSDGSALRGTCEVDGKGNVTKVD